MYCSKCGKQNEEGAKFCSECGATMQVQQNEDELQLKNSRSEIVAFVLGITGIIAWMIPIIGLPVGVTGLIFAIKGLKGKGKELAVAGLVLSIICIVLTIINSAIGAYQGYKGEAWFQRKDYTNVIEEDEYKEELRDGKYEFLIKNQDDKVLMIGGIKGASSKTNEDLDGQKTYAIEIQFTDEASEKFENITKDYLGEQIRVYIDDEMISEAKVYSVISGGTCQIANLDRYEDAKDLVEKINRCCEF